MPTPTPPHRMTDRAAVETFLNRSPAATAVVWNRAFDMDGSKEVYVEGDPVSAVSAIARPEWAGGAAGLALDAEDPAAAARLVAAWPRGEVFYHLTEEWMQPLAEARAESTDAGVFWLFALDAKDFAEHAASHVQPLESRWSDMIGRIWDPDWDGSGPYIRRRIEAGHAYAVYEEGKPVAWAFTHFETPKVGMMGFLHVLEGHRRKGYARAVASALAQDILGRGKIPALHVKTDNVPSLELTSSLGFHRVKKQVWAEAVMR